MYSGKKQAPRWLRALHIPRDDRLNSAMLERYCCQRSKDSTTLSAASARITVLRWPKVSLLQKVASFGELRPR